MPLPATASPSRPRRAAGAFGAVCAALLLAGAAAAPADAFAGPRGGGGYQGPRGGPSHGPAPRHWHGPVVRGPGWGWGWGGVTLGIGLGALAFSRPYYPYYYYDGAVIVERPTYAPADPAMSAPQPVPPVEAPTAPDPVIYPNRGQTPQQTEADRQECNRWATTQPNAVADASVFQRATAACMEGRGYTVR